MIINSLQILSSLHATEESHTHTQFLWRWTGTHLRAFEVDARPIPPGRESEFLRIAA